MRNTSNEYIASLKERFSKLDKDSLLDFELLELLLSYSVPPEEITKISNSIINSDNFRDMVDKTFEEVQIKQNTETIFMLKLFHTMMLKYLKPSINQKFNMSSPKAVAEYLSSYLRVEIGNLEQENFMVFLLNSQNELIHKEIMFKGTVEHCKVYPREIIKLALMKNANALILAHNHPSGSCKPSMEDILMNNKIKEIADYFGLRVHDHLIATENAVYSIRLDSIVT